MRFFKSHDQKWQEKQNYLKKVAGRTTEFLWFPRLLTNGQLAWLEWVNVDYQVRFDTINGEYYRWNNHPKYYTTRSDNRTS